MCQFGILFFFYEKKGKWWYYLIFNLLVSCCLEFCGKFCIRSQLHGFTYGALLSIALQNPDELKQKTDSL